MTVETEPCPACNGTGDEGTVLAYKRCGRCDGEGTIQKRAWKVEQRAGMLWRVVGPGGRVWGANKGCTQREAEYVAGALNLLDASNLAADTYFNELRELARQK